MCTRKRFQFMRVCVPGSGWPQRVGRGSKGKASCWWLMRRHLTRKHIPVQLVTSLVQYKEHTNNCIRNGYISENLMHMNLHGAFTFTIDCYIHIKLACCTNVHLNSKRVNTFCGHQQIFQKYFMFLYFHMQFLLPYIKSRF